MDKHIDDSNRGFTLIELLIGMALSMIIIGALYETFSKTNKAFNTQNGLVAAEQNTRIGIDNLLGDLRMTAYRKMTPDNNAPPGSRSVGAITRIFVDTQNDAVEMTFVYDWNDNGLIGDEDAEFITYRLDDDFQYNDPGYRDIDHRRLMRGTGSTPGNFQTIADNINSLIFTYFDSAVTPIPSTELTGTQQTNRDNIRTIVISMAGGTENIDGFSGGYKTITMQTAVAPRNLGY